MTRLFEHPTPEQARYRAIRFSQMHRSGLTIPELARRHVISYVRARQLVCKGQRIENGIAWLGRREKRFKTRQALLATTDLIFRLRS